MIVDRLSRWSQPTSSLGKDKVRTYRWGERPREPARHEPRPTQRFRDPSRPWLRRLIFLAGLSIGCLFLIRLPSASGATQAQLLAGMERVQPGQTFLAGVKLSMSSGFHTYWRNPGDSGLATTVEWTLPSWITPGEILWPVPEKLSDAGFTTYIYSQDTVLLIPLTVAANAPLGAAVLKAKVSWLECKELCVPGEAVVTHSILISPESQASPDAADLAAWEKRLPASPPDLRIRAYWEPTQTNDIRRLVMEFSLPQTGANGDFYAYSSERFEVSTETAVLPGQSGQMRLEKQVNRRSADWPETVPGILVAHPLEGQPKKAFAVVLKPGAVGPTGPVSPPTAAPGYPATTPPKESLWLMLLYALIGGLILNVMPCVLPVIALKIIGFVNQAQSHPRRVRQLGLIYAAGVLVSFFVLAVLVILVQRAGHQAGWGMQFGNPQFLVVLMTLVTLVALNLFGVFEVTLSSRALGAAVELSAREGGSGAFFNGVLATLLATPCTAPYLGYALGFAFAEPPWVIVCMFLAIGAGLALPYVLLSWQPSWLAILPKPGAWMERFKKAMGFPMLATVIWLFSLAALHYGRRLLWLGLFLLVVSAAAWVYGEFVQRGRRRRALAGGVVAGLLGFAWFYVLEGQLQWRAPIVADENSGALENNPAGLAWQKWSSNAVLRARAEKRPVLVDFTADWCLTCQANKKISIETPAVRTKLAQINAVALLADYTRVSPELTAELARFGRRGVPLVLVYPSDPGQPPVVLPEILTPQIMLDALNAAK